MCLIQRSDNENQIAKMTFFGNNSHDIANPSTNSYQNYYNECRTYLSQSTPHPCAIQVRSPTAVTLFSDDYIANIAGSVFQ
jgi:hypothetical protein